MALKSGRKKSARKKSARKKSSRRKSSRKTSARKRTGARSALARIEKELPPTLREYARQVRGELNSLEKDLERASLQYRRSAARLLREASHKLGELEARGEQGWRNLERPLRRDAQRLLERLGRVVKPGKKAARRKRG